MEKQLLSRKEAASFLGCSKGHVDNLIEEGRLKACNISPHKQRPTIRILKEELENFLNNNQM